MRRGVVGAVAAVGLVAAIGGAWWLRGGFAARPRLVPLERTPSPEEPRAEPRVDGAPLAADASPVADAPLDAPLDAETAAQRTEMRGPRATVVRHGRVVAAESGIELADALIRLPTGAPGGLLRDGLFSLQRGHELARSDANGRFAASVALDDWLVVAADGYAPRAVAATELGESIGGAPTFALERPARLRATVVAVDGAPAAGVTVRLLERRGPTRFVVEAISDAAGEALLEAVPPDCELVVELTEGMALLERESVTMRFAAGALQTRRFALRAARFLSGRVVDESGAPVAGAMVDVRELFFDRLRGRKEAEQRVRAEETKSGSIQWWRSGRMVDADGRFVLPIVDPCLAVVGVDPAPEELPAAQRWGAALAIVDFEPGRRGVTVTLPVERGLAITGRLVGPEGEPVAGTAAAIFSFEDGVIGQEDSIATDAEGRFAYHGVSRRTVLQLMGRSLDGALGSPEPVAATVADGEVTLRLSPRQRLLVRERGATGRRRFIEARLFAADGREWQPESGDDAFERLDDGRELEAAAVPAGRYDLYVLAAPVRRNADDAAPASDRAPVEADAAAGESDGLRVTWVRAVEVAASGTTVVEVELQRAATLELLAAEPPAGIVGARVLIDGQLLFKERFNFARIGTMVDTHARRLQLPPGEVVIEWIVAGRKTTEQLTLIAGETRRAAPPQRK